jgi:hypothetical protein
MGPSDDDFETAEPPDPAHALQLLDRLVGMVVSHVNPDSMNYRGSEPRYRQVRRELDSQLQQLGLRSPFPWDTLAEAKGVLKTYASQGGSHAARRGRVEELATSLRSQLQHRLDDDAAGDVNSAVAGLGALAEGVLADVSAIRQELARIERSVGVDPGQAIGRAKNLVEATAKAVLADRSVEFGRGDSMPQLAARAMEALGVNRRPLPGVEVDVAHRLAGRLGSIAEELARLRDRVGDGHGGLTEPTNVELRHGRLAVRAALAWCAFVLETMEETQKS